MKIIKGLAILFIAIFLGSCFDPPEYPNVPEIAFDRIEFYNSSGMDSLVLYLNFKDGDGDLGLSGELPKQISYPFHPRDFYQTSGETVVPLRTYNNILTNGDTLNILDIPDPSLGKLVFPRTRKQAKYSFLPIYDHCPQSTSSRNYEFLLNAHLFIERADSIALDEKVNISKRVKIGNTTFLEITDTLYYTTNPSHYNIEVDFLVKDPSSNHPDHPGFTEYDWRQQLCTTFDARFPILADNPGALEGTLRYSMNSFGFDAIFSIKTLKLRIQIKDRALNLSNVVFTREFTLDQI